MPWKSLRHCWFSPLCSLTVWLLQLLLHLASYTLCSYMSSTDTTLSTPTRLNGKGEVIISSPLKQKLDYTSSQGYYLIYFFLLGSVWPIIYHCMMAAVLLFQLLMVGILSKHFLPSTLTIVQPIHLVNITLTFAFSFKRFKPVRQWRHIGTFTIHHCGSLGRYTSAVDI